MAGWIHPDDIDRVSASGAPKSPAEPASVEDVRKALGNALRTGGLRRVPKHPSHRNIVMAILSLTLQRRHPYTEAQLNGELTRALAAMKAVVDHVTCRRYLVDLGFLKRNRAGSRYLLYPATVEAVLSPEAARAAPRLVREALAETVSRATRSGTTD